VAASALYSENVSIGFDHASEVAASLGEFVGRGLLTPDGATRFGKTEEYYVATQKLQRLVKMALTQRESSHQDV
jgi:hypothetical protein